jgi:pimeloyl-ACP methyl ester carboxylesterase
MPAGGQTQNETVSSFASYDGTEIGYRVLGDGLPLVCLPGGPGRAAGYLGDLGGLSASRQLVLLDPRGVGSSADPADPATFRVGRLVSDVESLRIHLGLERMDLRAHSAGRAGLQRRDRRRPARGLALPVGRRPGGLRRRRRLVPQLTVPVAPARSLAGQECRPGGSR